jgi:hypothetical protein
LGDALHFSEVEGLARLAADRAFDLDGTDGDGDAAGCAAARFALDVVNREGSLAGGEREKMEAAECLAAIAAVVEQVGLFLHQHAALFAGKEADGEVIGESAGGEPDGGFLAEGLRHGLFELGDHPANGVFVGFDGGGEFLEERGILRWGVMDAVTIGLDKGSVSGGGGGARYGGDDGGGEECAAVHMLPRVSC